MGKIFAAVFTAGIVSLILELSLLREFVYVVGSSAFSNSLIISVFLAGLSAGTYAGMWKRLASGHEKASRKKFALLQVCLLLFICIFYLTKEYFIYISASRTLIISYFILATFFPSFVAGAAYTTIVELLYHKGERYIVYVYAISTIGNVIGGLIHGYVFVYLTGIQSAYAFSVLCAAISAVLIYPFSKKYQVMILLIAGLSVSWIIQSNVLHDRLYRLDDLLFRKYSPSGLVEIWRTEDHQAVEMTVNNVHEYYSYDWDAQVHSQWAQTTLDIIRAPADILLLGYGSGVSSAAYLSSETAHSVDTVENTEPVLEAGKIYFPDEYNRVMHDPRSKVIFGDFRNYIRFTEKKYDIVLLDHSIIDPYYSGFFTVEFFNQLKRILKPNGVIASLGVGLSYDTMRHSFPYVYMYTAPGRELISESGFFLSMEKFDDDTEKNFTAEPPQSGGGLIYSDHRILGNSTKTAFQAIKRRVSRSIF